MVKFTKDSILAFCSQNGYENVDGYYCCYFTVSVIGWAFQLLCHDRGRDILLGAPHYFIP